MAFHHDKMLEYPNAFQYIADTLYYWSKEYGAGTQNWAILQDDRGVMYFGNNLRLLEFDGADWRLYSLHNNATVRSLAMGENGKIYAGSVGDLGPFLPDSTGELVSHSFADGRYSVFIPAVKLITSCGLWPFIAL